MKLTKLIRLQSLSVPDRVHAILRRSERTSVLRRDPSQARKRKRGVRTARRTVLWAGFVLLVLHAVLLTIGLRNPSLRDPVFDGRHRALRARIHSEKDAHAKLVLIFGTSRAGNAFDACGLEAILREETGEPIVAFNFAVPGEGPITQHIFLRRLLKKGIRPDFLVIEVLHAQYFDFGMPQESGTMIASRFLPSEGDCVAGYGVPTEAYRKSARELWANPWGELRYPILLHANDKLVSRDACVVWNQTSDAWGWHPIVENQPGLSDPAECLEMMRASYGPVVRAFKPNEAAVRALRDTLELCRKERIEVMLVQLPESSAFRSWYTAESKHALVDLFGRIAKDHECNWLDAQTWVPDGNFLDGHHLLRNGAMIFTHRFGRDAAAPWLQSVLTARASGRIR
jgi:hypothetical protein